VCIWRGREEEMDARSGIWVISEDLALSVVVVALEAFFCLSHNAARTPTQDHLNGVLRGYPVEILRGANNPMQVGGHAM
jgi:hypothetical protein